MAVLHEIGVLSERRSVVVEAVVGDLISLRMLFSFVQYMPNVHCEILQDRPESNVS
jgi:hypothetical protein